MKTSVIFTSLLAAVAMAAPSQIEERSGKIEARTGDWGKCLGKCVRGCKGPVPVVLACVAVCEGVCGAAAEEGEIVDLGEIFPESSGN